MHARARVWRDTHACARITKEMPNRSEVFSDKIMNFSQNSETISEEKFVKRQVVPKSSTSECKQSVSMVTYPSSLLDRSASVVIKFLLRRR